MEESREVVVVLEAPVPLFRIPWMGVAGVVVAEEEEDQEAKEKGWVSNSRQVLYW